MALCSDDKVSSRTFSVGEGKSITLFTVGHDPRLIDLSWKDDRTLLIRYPSDSEILPNFAVNRNGKAFKLSAPDMPRITTSPLAKMPPVQRWLW